MKTLSAAIALFAALPVCAQTVGSSGRCERERDAIEAFSLVVEWDGDEALVHSGGETLAGRAMGEPAAESLFMLSVKYDDPAMGMSGPSEIAIMRSPEAVPPEYWMGVVHYRDLPGGERVVDHIEAYRRATCVIRR